MEINIYSYSIKYRQSAPMKNPNYIFDCRGVTNPGRLEALKPLTGLDPDVITFLEKDQSAIKFRDSVKCIIIDSLDIFVSRQYTQNMSVGFCCTGGRHRSVYFAELFSRLFSQKEGVDVKVMHLDMNNNYY